MNYPRFQGPRVAIAQASPGQRVRLAGRVAHNHQGHLVLQDASGTLALLGSQAQALSPGLLVTLKGERTTEGLHIEHWQACTPTGQVPDVATTALVQAMRARDAMLRLLRSYFQAQDFLEVETPNLVFAPGMDVYLESFATRFTGMGQHSARDLYLHTSPEFAMKRLLCAGMERIFQICKVYRNAEWTPAHNPEFTMAEWYRAWAGYESVMDDVEVLVRTILLQLGPQRWDVPELHAPFARLTVHEAVRRHCKGLDLFIHDTEPTLRHEAERLGLGPLSPGGSWEDLFHQLLVTHVEPALQTPTFLIDYPRSLAVLSRVKDSDPRVAERFELYIHGVELCNGFTELNDPHEQRQRLEEEQVMRQAMGLDDYPMPEAFLQALVQGMPPSAGVALGLDRVLMLALGATDIGEVLMRPQTPAGDSKENSL